MTGSPSLPPADGPAIRLRGVTKVFRNPRRGKGLRGALATLFSTAYDETTAVDGVEFDVAPGEIVGYIGPNGAGKSTTIKMITGILKPTAGEIRVLGRDPFRARMANNLEIGAVFGQRTQLWWDIPPRESFRLLKDIYGTPDATYGENMALFEETLGLSRYAHVPVRKLSLGQRMACDIAASLLHGPRVLYLDEPTIGLDVTMKENIRRFVLEVNRRRGTTILLTTHDLVDITRLATRVIVIDRGRVILDDPLERLRNRYGRLRRFEAELSLPAEAASLAEAREKLRGRVNAFEGEPGAQRLAVDFDRDRIAPPELFACLHDRFEIRDFSLAEPGIETVIRRIYEEGAG